MRLPLGEGQPVAQGGVREEKEGHAEAESGLGGLVVKNDHAEESAGRGEKRGGDEQSLFRNPALFRAREQLVETEKEEGD